MVNVCSLRCYLIELSVCRWGCLTAGLWHRHDPLDTLPVGSDKGGSVCLVAGRVAVIGVVLMVVQSTYVVPKH